MQAAAQPTKGSIETVVDKQRGTRGPATRFTDGKDRPRVGRDRGDFKSIPGRCDDAWDREPTPEAPADIMKRIRRLLASCFCSEW